MPKKLFIISTLIGVSISTLGIAVPTFADSMTIYTVSDVSAKYDEFTTDIMQNCGEYNPTTEYASCVTRVTNSSVRKDPGRHAIIYSYNRLMKGTAVSAYNPYTGTMRFYINTNHMFRSDPTNFQNLVIFWADSSYEYNTQLASSHLPSTQEAAAWRVADIIINNEKTPQGVHVMYSSAQGKDNWFTQGVEQRVILEDEENFLTKSSPKQFFIMGYETNGDRYMQINNYGGQCADLSSDSECRLQFYYNEGRDSANAGYGGGQATPEDLALIRQAETISEEEPIIETVEEEIDLSEVRTETIETNKTMEETSPLSNKEVVASSDHPAKNNIPAVNNSQNQKTEEISTSNIKVPEKLPETPPDAVEVPLAAGKKEEHQFPWWLVVFTFSGIFLILWWFVPIRRRKEQEN